MGEVLLNDYVKDLIFADSNSEVRIKDLNLKDYYSTICKFVVSLDAARALFISIEVLFFQYVAFSHLLQKITFRSVALLYYWRLII